MPKTPVRHAPSARAKGPLASLASALPSGTRLAPEVFAARHRFLRAILLLHIPVLGVVGFLRLGAVRVCAGMDLSCSLQAWHVALELALPLGLWVVGRWVRGRRPSALLVTIGLTWCSAVLVHFSGGQIEAHFHFFVVVTLVMLYQGWLPLAWTIAFIVLQQGLTATYLNPRVVFDHISGQRSPWVWAAIHGAAVLAAAMAQAVLWKASENQQRRASEMASEMALANANADRRHSVASLITNLARRNQSLLERQLGLITSLEAAAEDPDTLAELFKLDHLATRMRRNAESLIVLSGDEPARRWREPLPLSEVVRGAIAEIEDYTRPTIELAEDPAVDGRVVANLAHLLAELLENATQFSPPGSPVVVRGRWGAEGEAFQLDVEDRGLGMDDHELAALNERLAQPIEVDLDLSRMLGLHVVARLAHRHDAKVSLHRNADGGTTATVLLARRALEGTPLLGPAEAPTEIRLPDVPSFTPAPPAPTAPAAPAAAWSIPGPGTKAPQPAPVVPVEQPAPVAQDPAPVAPLPVAPVAPVAPAAPAAPVAPVAPQPVTAFAPVADSAVNGHYAPAAVNGHPAVQAFTEHTVPSAWAPAPSWGPAAEPAAEPTAPQPTEGGLPRRRAGRAKKRNGSSAWSYDGLAAAAPPTESFWGAAAAGDRGAPAQPAAAEGQDRVAAPATQAAPGAGGDLVRRVPKANMAPQIHAVGGSAPQRAAAAGPGDPAARSSLGSYQNSTMEGRAAAARLWRSLNEGLAEQPALTTTTPQENR